jgi:iron complex outermembrane recepter protein
MKTKNPVFLLIGWIVPVMGPTQVTGAADSGQPSVTEITSGSVSNRAAGIVSGRVSNQATGDFLPGAIVRVEGMNAGVSTDRDGYFNISVPAGERMLLVQFTGLDTARIVVNVESGKRIERDVPLTSEIYKLEKFSVTGIREGTALAIQLQRNALNAKTVAATDTFGNPASNPGELLQRLPGITVDIVGSEVRSLNIRGMGTGFTALLLDGNQMANSSSAANRSYQIEQYGTGNVETLELIKAPTPDMDASAIGGYVNLISKRAFDSPGRQVTLTAGTNWRVNHYNQNPSKDRPDNLDLIVLGFSDAFNFAGGKRNLGIAVNLSRRVASTLSEELGGGQLAGAAGAYVFTNPQQPLQRYFGAGFYQYPDFVAYNFGFNIDYKLSEHTVGYLRTTFNKNSYVQTGFEMATSTTASVASFEPASTYDFARALPLPASKTEAITWNQNKFSQNYMINPGFEQKLFDGGAKLNIDGTFSHARIWYPGDIQPRAEVTGVGWEMDRRGRDPWVPAFTQTSGPSIYDPTNYALTTYLKLNRVAPSDTSSLRLDFRRDFNLPVPAYVKLGAKYAKTKWNQEYEYNYRTYAGPDGLLNTGDEKDITPYLAGLYRLGGGRYGPFPQLQIPESGAAGDPAKIPASYWTQTSTDAYNSVNASFANDADFTESIRAAYISGHVNLGKLRILAGMRVEDTRTEGTAYVKLANSSTTLLSTASAEVNAARALAQFTKGRETKTGQYRNVFPGLHFVYEPRDGWLVRASYNQSISRPPIGNILPIVTISDTGGTISTGNPELKPYRSNNFEASIEKYMEPVGLVSASLFLKEITDYFRSIDTPIGTGPSNGFNGEYAGYTLRQVENTGGARIRGVELSYQQQYSFLPGFWKGFGSYANFTYQQTQGDYGTTTFQKRLAGFSPRSGNAGISYVGYGLQARLLANWRDETYRGGADATTQYSESRLMLDLKLQYTIRRSYDVFLDVSNLTDEASSTSVLAGDLKYYRTNQGVSFSAGVKARF